MNPNPSIDHQVTATGGEGGGGELIAAADARALLQFHEADHSSGSHEMEDDRYAAGENKEIEMEGPSGPSNLGDPNRTAVPGAGAGNQLTLSFQGDVYVSDNVSPEKGSSSVVAARGAGNERGVEFISITINAEQGNGCSS